MLSAQAFLAELEAIAELSDYCSGVDIEPLRRMVRLFGPLEAPTIPALDAGEKERAFDLHGSLWSQYYRAFDPEERMECNPDTLVSHYRTYLRLGSARFRVELELAPAPAPAPEL